MTEETENILKKCFKTHSKESKILLVGNKPFLVKFADIAEKHAKESGLKVETITKESLFEKPKEVSTKTETKDNAKSETKK